MNVFVAIPIHRPIEFHVFESFVKLANHRGQHNLMFGMAQNSLVYDARETLVDAFLKSPCDAIMFIDSDMVFDHRSIDFLMRHEKPFVCAKAFKRVYPYQPCFYSKVELLEDDKIHLESPVEYGQGLLPIQGAGLACALIRREVFSKIEKPYFFPKNNLGEDLTFCLSLKNAGIEMFVDTTIQFGHLGSMIVFEENFQSVYNEHKAKNTVDKLFVGGES